MSLVATKRLKRDERLEHRVRRYHVQTHFIDCSVSNANNCDWLTMLFSLELMEPCSKILCVAIFQHASVPHPGLRRILSLFARVFAFTTHPIIKLANACASQKIAKPPLVSSTFIFNPPKKPFPRDFHAAFDCGSWIYAPPTPKHPFFFLFAASSLAPQC